MTVLHKGHIRRTEHQKALMADHSQQLLLYVQGKLAPEKGRD
jgi:hypothetical protein